MLKPPRSFTLACITSPGSLALDFIPAPLRSHIVVSNDASSFDAQAVSAILWIPPGGSKDTVKALIRRIREETGSPPGWVHSFFAGVDGLQDALGEMEGARTTNGRGAFSSSLAEYCVAVVMHFNKQVPRLIGNFGGKKWDPFVMNRTKGKTVGFLGWGSIARECKPVLKALGMNVLAYRRNKAAVGQEDVEFVQDKMELAKRSDYVMNTLPSTVETQNFCDEEFFAAMKTSGVFCNMGRGATVDEDAIADALKSNRISGAALDVFKKEPLPESSLLWSCPNLLMTSHNADNTEDYLQLGWKVFLQNYECFLNDFKVDPDSPYQPTFFDSKQGY